MARTQYDAENNVLHILKDQEVENVTNTTLNTTLNTTSDLNNEANTIENTQIEQRKLRGFIVTVVDNEEELKELQNGDGNKMQLSPILASDENEAVEVAKQHGKIPVNVVNYELLKLQTTLIEELANNENVELLQLNLFNVNNS